MGFDLWLLGRLTIALYRNSVQLYVTPRLKPISVGHFAKPSGAVEDTGSIGVQPALIRTERRRILPYALRR
jgi:hypothetical protein